MQFLHWQSWQASYLLLLCTLPLFSESFVKAYYIGHTNSNLGPRCKQPSETLVTNSAGALSFLTSLGGIIGYVRTGSIPSVAAGLSVGALYLFSLFQLRNGQPYGEEIGLLASAVLGGSAVPRAIKTNGKPVPVGLSILATYGLLVFGLAYRHKRAVKVWHECL